MRIARSFASPSPALALIGLALLGPGLGGCASAPSAASAQEPHAMTRLHGNWQVGASEMRDAQGRQFTVCTLLQTNEGDRRFWLAATPAAVSGDLYLGLRSPDLPAVEGRVDRKAVIEIDGTRFSPARSQQAGDALSMAIPAAATEAFLDAFAKGANLVVTAADLPRFAQGADLQGSANGRREWRKCIETELQPARS
ncbi:hypothetical protein [Zavarzinia compransoris]|uniref:Alkaline proteinase inhibitor/ Outer membrane lipoprotein Omp19 domain-containing protein n=1 Tax=Zavarzinia compransoris TaxID=1264899 RepID=A0A317E2J1_9PROT|nr:hypothetical protein [Zavarzinia compransoris]PWR20634.1 hypothetical protein DKG75_11555 [Zavarzinia compransoris]TDP44549.1 hypothetical protein DES42_107317 [Zavarzinia compransoris]